MGRETVGQATAGSVNRHIRVWRRSLLFNIVDGLGTEIIVVG
jgi:hypothetical protein